MLDSSALVTPISPSGSGVGDTPNFSWSYPSNPGNYLYSFSVWGNNGTIWQIPGQNSNSNGFANTDIPSALTWGVGPTNSSNMPSPSSLSDGGNYQWSVRSTDGFGNTASAQMNFETVATALMLPAPNPSTLPSAMREHEL